MLDEIEVICWCLLLGPSGKVWGCLSCPSFLGFVYNLCLLVGEHVCLPIRLFKLWPFRLAEVAEPHGPFQKPRVLTSPCSLPPCSHTSTQSRKGRLEKGFAQWKNKLRCQNSNTLWGMKPGFPAALRLAGALEARQYTVSAFNPRRWLSQGRVRLWRWASEGFLPVEGSGGAGTASICGWQVRFHFSWELALFLLFSQATSQKPAINSGGRLGKSGRKAYWHSSQAEKDPWNS